MGFISLVYIGIYLIIMIIGFLELLTAAIIFVVRKVRRKSRPVGRASKIVAIIFLVFGILCETPALIMAGLYMAERKEAKTEYANLSDTYQLDIFPQDEFTYKDKRLVLISPDEQEHGWLIEPEMDFETNLIFSDSDETYEYEPFYKLHSEAPYDMYIMPSYSKIYVAKEDLRRVIDFYQSEAHYKMAATCDHSNVIRDMSDVDKRKIDRMTEAEACTYPASDREDSYCLTLSSTDGINEKEYSFLLMKDGNFVFTKQKISKKTKEIKGRKVSGEDAEYLKKQISACMDPH